MNIPLEAIQKLSGASADTARLWKPYMDRILPKYEINTPARIAAFLSQVGWESGRLTTLGEIGAGAGRYYGKEDSRTGKVYYGRGLMQLSLYDNYDKYGKYKGVDFLSKPELIGEGKAINASAKTLEYALDSASWFWTKQGGKDLNLVADTLDMTKPITDPKNAVAYNKLTDKINYYEGADKRAGRMSIFQRGQDYVWKTIKANPRGSIAVGLVVGLLLFGGVYWWLSGGKKVVNSAISS
ncbi:MAG: hypothetical protein EXR21_09995 [Flavobacteriaceae bacterium]|nr:hypothetical protein [Flavobacteriaceae bacterium]